MQSYCTEKKPDIKPPKMSLFLLQTPQNMGLNRSFAFHEKILCAVKCCCVTDWLFGRPRFPRTKAIPTHCHILIQHKAFNSQGTGLHLSDKARQHSAPDSCWPSIRAEEHDHALPSLYGVLLVFPAEFVGNG